MKETGIKHDDGKIQLSILPWAPLREVTKVFMFGAKKYGRDNYKGGMEWTRLSDAALRHITDWIDGEDKDPESGLPHLAHAGCCILMLLYYSLKGVGDDDRYKENE